MQSMKQSNYSSNSNSNSNDNTSTKRNGNSILSYCNNSTTSVGFGFNYPSVNETNKFLGLCDILEDMVIEIVILSIVRAKYFVVQVVIYIITVVRDHKQQGVVQDIGFYVPKMIYILYVEVLNLYHGCKIILHVLITKNGLIHLLNLIREIDMKHTNKFVIFIR